MRLYTRLKNYSKKRFIAMHMPGHKRHNFFKNNNLPYNIDITEIDGFDNLHSASGILKESQDNASKLFGSKKTFFLVNGSTCGILASIKSVCNINDKILIAKNCHKSVYNAIELLNLDCKFIPSHFDRKTNIHSHIYPQDVDDILKKEKNIKCVVITSPTYEGVISNIKRIAQIVHKYNLPLIVDEAHGSHLYLMDKSSCKMGADIVINSLHKTLPSLTQTALLHICSYRIDVERVRKNLSIFETSSPSYILLASIDECINFMQNKGEKFFKKYNENLNIFKEKVKNLKFLKIIYYNINPNFYDFDFSKIVILTHNSNINGQSLMNKLREKKIELEMCYTNYALAMTTIFDTKQDLLKLANALLKIDKELSFSPNKFIMKDIELKSAMTIYNALKLKNTTKSLENSINHISAEYVYVYPPGIPLLIPGQIISEDIIKYIKYLSQNNLNLISTSCLLPSQIKVCKKY